MTWKDHFDELQGEILRSIFRSNQVPNGRWVRPKAQIAQSERLKETAALLFAAGNGWQYQPNLRGWDGLFACACGPCEELLRSVAYQPLLFMDKQGKPVAFASQPRRQERCELDRGLRSLGDKGLYTNNSPAAYASIAEPGQCQFLVFTRQRLPVRWLPEQEERNSQFSVHRSEAPNFRKFIKEARSSNSKCQEALDCLRYVIENDRRQATPDQIVSFCHFKAYLYGIKLADIQNMEDQTVAAIWSQYETWSKQELSLILKFDEEIGEFHERTN